MGRDELQTRPGGAIPKLGNGVLNVASMPLSNAIGGTRQVGPFGSGRFCWLTNGLIGM
ncbi:MAG: hypothetical protein RKO25_06745 [Candidatus Contendobacter sp.]|nr:hypothetical protein [Candidatus Contendobacter sp.]